MIRQFSLMWTLGLALFLAGCGGSGGDGVLRTDPGLGVFQDALAADEPRLLAIMGDPNENIRGIPGTVWTSVPTTGQAIFRGVGVGQVSDAAGVPDVVMRGDVFLTVNFGADDINGRMIRMSASDGARVYDVAGEIDFFNGNIGEIRPSSFTLDYGADLDIGGTDYVLDGAMDGLLRGTRFGVVRRSPVKALSAVDDAGVALVDGVEQPFNLTIVGETN